MEIRDGKLISVDESDIVDGKFVVPEGVKIIGPKVFERNQKLEEIIISEGVESIQYEAFQFCEHLTTVKFPETLNSIGASAFYRCLSLREAIIPDSVTNIYNGAFSNCVSLKKIILPKDLDEIAEYLLTNCASLKEVIIPESVTAICESAFMGCVALEEIVIPDMVEIIGVEAFKNCRMLKKIVLPLEGCSISYGAFGNCKSLEEVNLPKGIKYIEDKVFEDCSSLKEINIPNSVQSIGSRTFANCTSLTKISTPESVSRIDDLAFEKCSSLSVIDLQNGVIDLSPEAFNHCFNVKSLKMPICSVFHYICENSTQLEEIKNPDEEKYKFIDGILYSIDGTELVKYPKYLKSSKFILPKDVKIIFERAFKNCDKLQQAVLPKGLIEIGDGAFSGCSSLQEVNIPDTVTGLWDGIFTDCVALQSIELPDSLEAIGYDTFTGCKALKNVNCFGVEVSLQKFESLELAMNANTNFVKYALKNQRFLPKNTQILTNTPDKEIENYYKCSKAWAAVQKEYISRFEGHEFAEAVINLYQLSIALGLFQQSRTNKVVEFLSKNILTIEPKVLHQYLGSMDTRTYGFVEEFADFFMQNYHKPISEVYEDVGSVEIPFLWFYDEEWDQLRNCVDIAYKNWIGKVKKAYPNRTVMAHREAESESESFTEEIVLNAINSKEYDCSPGFEKLAEACGPYNYSDEDYEKLELWFKIAKLIKPEDMVLCAEKDTQKEGITFELLAKDNERTAILGELTNCCQVVDDAGKDCLYYGMTSENSGFVEFDYNGKIIGQSWVWYNPETQIVCLDNIEVPARLISKLNKNKDLYEGFINCLNRLAESFKKAMEKKGHIVKAVTIGEGYLDLYMLDDYYSSFDPMEEFPDGFLPNDYNGYTDAKFKQYVVSGDIKEKTTDDLLV